MKKPARGGLDQRSCVDDAIKRQLRVAHVRGNRAAYVDQDRIPIIVGTGAGDDAVQVHIQVEVAAHGICRCTAADTDQDRVAVIAGLSIERAKDPVRER